MEENELQEFSLDDIMREFGADPEEVAQELAEVLEAEGLIDEEETPDAPVEEPAVEELVEETAAAEETASAEEPAIEEESSVTSDTIRLGDTLRLGDTIRLDTSAIIKGTVRNAEPILEEDLPAEDAGEDAFTKTWEPEYEQPIGEYVPPQPILFHPRSRLQELKKKLMEGPEKQYYALVEKGFGKLQVAMFLNLLVVLVSAGATVMYAFGGVSPERMKLLVFSQFLAMLLSALLGSFQLIDGITDLFHKRFTLNTLLVFTFIACCADGVLCLKTLQVPCCAAFSLQVTMSLWSTYQQRNTRMGQFDTMRKATKLDSVCMVEDYYQGAAGMLRGEGQVEDFMDTYHQRTTPDKILSVYAMVALCVSLGIGVAAGILHGVVFGIRVMAVTLLAAMPATIFITVSRPFAVLERRLHGLGTVLCGWQGVVGLCKNAVFPLEFADFYPGGAVKLNGVKFFGKREPDDIIAYATALVKANNSGLAPLFDHLLDSRNGIHYTPENYRTYEEGGIGGEVAGLPVLVGSLSFLERMGVELPRGIRVGSAVCVSVDGELCGLFAMAYEKVRSSAAGLTTLSAYRGLSPVLISDDFNLTPDFLRAKFGLGVRKMLFPTAEEREQLREKTAEDAKALLLTTAEGLAPLAYGVTGAKAVKTATTLGVVTHMIGGIVGILMMIVLAILGQEALLTPANLFLYELIWMIPGILITEWTRVI